MDLAGFFETMDETIKKGQDCERCHCLTSGGVIICPTCAQRLALEMSDPGLRR